MNKKLFHHFLFLSSMLLQLSWADELPICPIYQAPIGNSYAWQSCEGVPQSACTFGVGANWVSFCYWSGGRCQGSYGLVDGTEMRCDRITSQDICKHRLGCDWQFGECRNAQSSLPCRPLRTDEAWVDFEGLKNGSFACIFKAKTPTFDPFTVDGTQFKLKIRSPSVNPSTPNVAREFVGPAVKVNASNRFEFHVPMTSTEVDTIRVNRMELADLGTTVAAPRCEARFEVPDQSSGVNFQPEGGGLQCQCPEEFMRMAEGYNEGGLYAYFDNLATANRVSNVEDACAPGHWKRLSQLPTPKVDWTKLALNYPYNCGADFDPLLRASYPEVPWNLCFGNSSAASQYIEKSSGWLRACLDDRTQQVYEYIWVTNSDGDRYQEAKVKELKLSFPSELEKDVGVFHFQYLMRQVEETQKINAEHVRIANAIVMSLDANQWAPGKWNKYIPAESLKTARRIYQRRLLAEMIWSALPETRWDQKQYGLNKAEILAYLVNPQNPVVAAGVHWSRHRVPDWKVKLFNLICHGAFYCGMDTLDPRVAYAPMQAKLLRMIANEEQAIEKTKVEMPWMAGVVDLIDQAAADRMYSPNYREDPVNASNFAGIPNADWFKAMIRPHLLSFFRAQQTELIKLQTNLVKLKASLTCSTPTNRLSPQEFDSTMRALVDIPAKPQEAYAKCRASDRVPTPDGLQPVCKTFEGSDEGGLYCYCEGISYEVSSQAKRQVTRDQIEWRRTATEVIRSQRAWAKSLDEINGTIRATAFMALTSILGPGILQAGATALVRAGATFAKFAELGILTAETAQAESLAYWGGKAWDAYQWVMKGKAPAAALFKYTGYALDAAAYMAGTGALAGRLTDYCEAKYLNSPRLGDDALAYNGTNQSLIDVSLESYFNCIRNQIYAATALRFTSLASKLGKAKVGDTFEKPANPVAKAEAEVMATKLVAEAEKASLKTTTAAAGERIVLTNEEGFLINPGEYTRIAQQLEGKVIVFGNGHSFLLGKYLNSGNLTNIYVLAEYPSLVIRLPKDGNSLLRYIINHTIQGYPELLAHGVQMVRMQASADFQYVIMDRVFSGTERSISLADYVWRYGDYANRTDMRSALTPFIRSTRDFHMIGDFKLSQVLWDDIDKRWVLVDWINHHELITAEALQCFSAKGTNPEQFQFIQTLDEVLNRIGDSWGLRDQAIKALR